MKCPLATQEKRRCWEDRWDFTAADDATIFPIYVHQGGELYGFCPGKANRDPEVQQMFRVLLIAAETGVMLKPGGLDDQPEEFVSLLAWMIPRLDMVKFSSKVSMFLPNSRKAKHEAFVAQVKREQGIK